MTSRQFDAHDIHFDLGPDAVADWSDVMLEHHGLYCRFADPQTIQSTAQSWSLGEVSVTLADLTAVALAPVGEEKPSWQGEWLYMKLMSGGQVDIEQAGHQHRFKSGSVFFIDPGSAFQESFVERGQMTVLRIPKANLRDRGLKHSLNGLVVLDMDLADMRATRDLIHCIAQQRFSPSPVIRELMGRQLLELIDATLGRPGERAVSRSTDAVLLRAKRYIHQHLSDTRLDSAAIAAAAHISVKHLQHLFRTQDTTVMRHVWSVRLAHARRLLNSVQAVRPSVQEVAWQCGFSTAAHFSRAYREHFGFSPSQATAAAD